MNRSFILHPSSFILAFRLRRGLQRILIRGRARVADVIVALIRFRVHLGQASDAAVFPGPLTELTRRVLVQHSRSCSTTPAGLTGCELRVAGRAGTAKQVIGDQ